MQGTVIRTAGSSCLVRTTDGGDVECTVRGNFRLKGIRTTNPVAVGDNVEITVSPEGGGMIVALGDRKNYIIRKATNLSKQSQILAKRSPLSLTALLLLPKPMVWKWLWLSAKPTYTPRRKRNG